MGSGVQLSRRHLLIPVALLVFWLVHPGGLLDRRREFQLHRHPHSVATAVETAIAGVASSLADRRVEVRCRDLSEADSMEPLGRVQFVGDRPLDYMELRPDVCTTLMQVRRDPVFRSCAAPDAGCWARVDRTAKALAAVAHESYHLRGVRNEAVTQCYALQRVRDTARAFGISGRAAGALAGWAYRVDYPRMPPAYVTPACGPGGHLDLYTGSPWLG